MKTFLKNNYSFFKTITALCCNIPDTYTVFSLAKLRKERSAEAARNRRHKENKEYDQVKKLLPIDEGKLLASNVVIRNNVLFLNNYYKYGIFEPFFFNKFYQNLTLKLIILIRLESVKNIDFSKVVHCMHQTTYKGFLFIGRTGFNKYLRYKKINICDTKLR